MNILISLFFILFASLIIVYSFKDIKISIYLFLFYLIAIPFSWGFFEVLHLYFNIGNTKISIQEALLLYLIVSMLIIFFKNKKVVLVNKTLFYINIFWALLLLVYLIIGLKNNPLEYVFNDVRNLMFYSFIYIAFVILFTKKDIITLLKVIISSSIVFNIINTLVYEFKGTFFIELLNSTTWADADRIGFTNSLIIIFLLPIAVFITHLNMSKKWTYLIYFSVGTSIVTVLINKSVNLFLSAAFVFIFSLLVKRYVDLKNFNPSTFIKKSVKSIIFLVLISIPLSLPVYYYIQNMDSLTLLNFFDKINQALIDPTQLNSWKSRMITNAYALSEFENNIWGYGLGKTFQTFIQTGALASEAAMYVDNTFYTVVNKMGIPGIIFYYLYLGVVFVLLVRNAKKAEQQFKGLLYGFVGAYIALLLTMVSTSQIYRNPIVIVIVQLIILSSFTLAKKGNIKLEEDNHGGESRVL